MGNHTLVTGAVNVANGANERFTPIAASGLNLVSCSVSKRAITLWLAVTSVMLMCRNIRLA